MFHNLRAKYFKKYSLPAKKPLSQLWQDVMTLLDQKKYTDLIMLYKQSDFDNRLSIIEVIGDLKNFDDLEDFCNDNLNEYVCLLILGVIYIELAQKERGGASADQTSEEQFKGMHENAEKSFHILLEALELNREDKIIFITLTGSMLYLSVEMDEIDELYEEAKLLEGSNYLLNRRMLNIKTPKWLGSKESLFDFVNNICSGISKGDPNLALVAIAHYEYCLYLNMQGQYMKSAGHIMDEKVIGDIKKACRDFIGSAKPNKESMYAASSFLFFALEFNDKSMAKVLLEFTELNIEFDVNPWFYEDNYEQKYNALRYLAKL